MPFAMNEATEYINPTKALEYMATGKPVVSMPVEDVVLQFSETVDIADSHEEFIAMCHRAAAEPDRAQIERGLELVRKNSWEAIVRKLEQHIEDALDAKRDQVAISAA
jgi:glycosyltransferase involved in cell wall biosynthesis